MLRHARGTAPGPIRSITARFKVRAELRSSQRSWFRANSRAAARSSVFVAISGGIATVVGLTLDTFHVVCYTYDMEDDEVPALLERIFGRVRTTPEHDEGSLPEAREVHPRG